MLSSLPVEDATFATVTNADYASTLMLSSVLDGGALLRVPIVGAVLLVSIIGGVIVWASLPSVGDDEDD